MIFQGVVHPASIELSQELIVGALTQYMLSAWAGISTVEVAAASELLKVCLACKTV